MRELYDKVEKQEGLRESLIAIKAAIQEPESRRELQALFAKSPQALFRCLDFQEDPKVRKNGAAILGKLTGEEIPQRLWEAYEREEQLFVRSDYLKALESFPCGAFAEAMRHRQEEIEKILLTAGQDKTEAGTADQGVAEREETKSRPAQKHLRQELQALRRILLSQEPPRFHPFIGFGKRADVMLLTNRGQERLLAGQIGEGRIRLGKGAVLAEQALIEPLLSVRTYRELLFCLKSSGKLKKEKLTQELLKTDLLEILEKYLKGEPPYYFRVEVKTRKDSGFSGDLAKSLGAQLEEESGGMLLNAPSAYELELRLKENREGSFFPLLKLQALPDHRFAYRRQTVAASMAPVQAAICMELAAAYLKEQAQVLDPFCGVGTMLLERNYKLHARSLYGIDLYAPAIAGARENAQAAGVPAHFINRDCLTFTHEYLFDEIVTNFPVKGRGMDAHALDSLYGRFLDKARELLKPQGILLLYSRDRGYLKKQLRLRPEWQLKEEWCVSEREEAYLFCIGRE